jgi:hypothetical protein
MAMAIHSAHIAATNVSLFLREDFTRSKLIESYNKQWNRFFSSRMRYGKWIQGILIHPGLTRVMYSLIQRLPFLLPLIIRKTHGKPIKP